MNDEYMENTSKVERMYYKWMNDIFKKNLIMLWINKRKCD